MMLRPTALPMHVQAMSLVVGLALAGGAQAATLTVTNNADSGAGSLRQALADAANGDTIDFSGPMTITLGTALDVSSGVTVDGDVDGNGSPDVVVSGNDAVRVLQVTTAQPVVLNGLIITRGADVGGAGISVAFNGNITVRRCELSHNHEPGIGGGALYASNASVTLIDTLVAHNSSGSFGGGLRVVGGSVLTVSGSTVTGNQSADNGGGIQAAGTVTIINSTISGNSAQGANAVGGGVRISSGTSHITHTTIVGNAAEFGGGGLSAQGTDTLTNVAVAGNTAGAGATAGAAGSPLASGGSANDVHETIETATDSYFGTPAAITANQNSLTNQGTAALLLETLATAGGTTPTHRPQQGSVLKDAATCLSAVATDQRGVPRPQDGLCDIGAVELALIPSAAPASASATPGDGSVTVTWDLVTVHSDSPITGYTITGTPGGTCAVGPADTQCTINGLSNGQSHIFALQAVNAIGAGPAVMTSAVTPQAAPLPTGPAAIPTLSPWGLLLLSALLGALALRQRHEA